MFAVPAQVWSGRSLAVPSPVCEHTLASLPAEPCIMQPGSPSDSLHCCCHRCAQAHDTPALAAADTLCVSRQELEAHMHRASCRESIERSQEIIEWSRKSIERSRKSIERSRQIEAEFIEMRKQKELRVEKQRRLKAAPTQRPSDELAAAEAAPAAVLTALTALHSQLGQRLDLQGALRARLGLSSRHALQHARWLPRLISPPAPPTHTCCSLRRHLLAAAHHGRTARDHGQLAGRARCCQHF